MTKLVGFHGASDDLVELLDGDGMSLEEADVLSQIGDKDYAIFEITPPEGEGLQVILSYIGDGVWSAGIAQQAEDSPLPAWAGTARFTAEKYWTTLWIELPDGTQISNPGLPGDVILENDDQEGKPN